MTRRRDDGDPSGLPAVSPIPDAAEMEATDHYLDRLAAGAAPAPSDAAGRLLRDAAAPGEEPELAGSAAFAAAVAASVEERSTATAAPRTFTVLGRVVAAKVVAIIAIATLGLAGAGAATGAVLHAADRRSPANTTVEVVPDSEAPEAPGGEPDEDTSGRRHHPGELSLAEATERIATCDAATSAQGSERLVDAAAAADTTPAEYCAEAVAAIESTATESDTESTTDVEDAERGAGASNGSDPAGNAAEHRDDAAVSHTPAPGRSGAGSGGAANAGGNTSNSGGNANANAGGANSGGNANANAGGANAGTPNANANANAGGANAGTPNANANANANRTSTTPGSSSTGAAATGARSTGQGAASSPGRSGVIPWGVCAAECSAPRVTDPPTPAAASTSRRSSATSAPRTVVSASDPRSRP